MTWIVVDLTPTERKGEEEIWRTKFRYECREWLRNNLSSNGVLWKNDWSQSIYYFAQEQDAVMFKLKFMR